MKFARYLLPVFLLIAAIAPCSAQARAVRLIVIRHGEAIHNLTSSMASSRSPGIYLTEKGIDQVQKAALALKNEQIDHVYVSPVFRTLQTAQHIAKELHIPHQKITIDDNLREQFFGAFEGRSYDEYISYFSEEKEAYYGAVPEGESGHSVANRTQDFLHSILSKHSNATILVVTHAFNCVHIGKLLTGEFPEAPEQAAFTIYDPQRAYLCGLMVAEVLGRSHEIRL